MDVSTLESLPNEVLLELFANHMRGIDVLVGFVGLTERINAIIDQCTQFSLDFRHCRKVNFRSCLHSLQNANHIGKVEELILSEQNTSGQIHAFFTAFPSFVSFTSLQRLYLYTHGQWIDWSVITVALRSLSTIPIETISINHMTENVRRELRIPLDTILNLSTLRRLSFIKDHSLDRWFQSGIHPSRIEYLKYIDSSVEILHNFELLRYIPHLKYLDVQWSERLNFRSYYLFNIWDEPIDPFVELRTLILTFTPYDSTTVELLKPVFKRMSALQRLEITAHQGLLVAEEWEELLRTSLPSLRYFRLKSTKSRLPFTSINIILDSFESPFWQNKENFYLILTEHGKVNSNGFYPPADRIDDRSKSFQVVKKWWIVPKRARKDDIPTKDFINLGITDDFKYLSDYYYFNNVKYLVIFHLDATLVECISTSVNCSGIEHLDVSFFDHQSNAMPLLLEHLNNIVSLRIQCTHLLQYQNVYATKLMSIKYLDISVDNCRLSEEDIRMISVLFPQLRHLAIGSIGREFLAPLLKRYLPNLWSLIYGLPDQRFLPVRIDQDDQIVLEQDQQWRTVWIDDEALNKI